LISGEKIAEFISSKGGKVQHPTGRRMTSSPQNKKRIGMERTRRKKQRDVIFLQFKGVQSMPSEKPGNDTMRAAAQGGGKAPYTRRTSRHRFGK